MKATLTQNIGWRGATYLKGDRQIPDELAIALGLVPETVQPAAEIMQPAPETVQPAAETVQLDSEIMQPAAETVQPEIKTDSVTDLPKGDRQSKRKGKANG
jgi:enoyl-CoA hydratase/carnithine racemase